MRRLFIAFASLAVLAAAPAVAQQDDHRQHHPAPPAEAAAADAALHEKCKAMHGAHMEGRPPHDHGKDKTGAATLKTERPTEAEMKKMHEACVARMKKAETK